MAKKAWMEKVKRKPKFKVRGYYRCQRCGRSRGTLRKFRLCRICFRELALRGEIPACAKPVGKRTEHEMSMTDPVADMLTRVRNACQAGHRRVDMPVSKLKVEIARLLRDNHYVQDFKCWTMGVTGCCGSTSSITTTPR